MTLRIKIKMRFYQYFRSLLSLLLWRRELAELMFSNDANGSSEIVSFRNCSRCKRQSEHFQSKTQVARTAVCCLDYLCAYLPYYSHFPIFLGFILTEPFWEFLPLFPIAVMSVGERVVDINLGAFLVIIHYNVNNSIYNNS